MFNDFFECTILRSPLRKWWLTRGSSLAALLIFSFAIIFLLNDANPNSTNILNYFFFYNYSTSISIVLLRLIPVMLILYCYSLVFTLQSSIEQVTKGSAIPKGTFDRDLLVIATLNILPMAVIYVLADVAFEIFIPPRYLYPDPITYSNIIDLGFYFILYLVYVFSTLYLTIVIVILWYSRRVFLFLILLLAELIPFIILFAISLPSFRDPRHLIYVFDNPFTIGLNGMHLGPICIVVATFLYFEKNSKMSFKKKFLISIIVILIVFRIAARIVSAFGYM